MREHILKIHPQYFRAVVDGTKTFEVRKDDRGYKVGDTLEVCEYDPEEEEHSGRMVRKEVSYVLKGGDFGVEEG